MSTYLNSIDQQISSNMSYAKKEETVALLLIARAVIAVGEVFISLSGEEVDRE
jgi:hypothetical protein